MIGFHHLLTAFDKFTMAEESDVAESVTQLLECPVCMNQMQPPIEMCQNGHNLCNVCKPKLTVCPLCQGAFSNVRNRALESVSENMKFNCENEGCKDTYTLADKEKHLKICPGRQYECLPKKKDGCTWKGKLSELLNHITTDHKEFLTYTEFPSKIHFFVKLGVDGIRLAKVDDDLFWIYIKQDPVRRKFFRAVQHIGPVENAAKYIYNYEFDLSDKSSTSIIFKRKVFTELDNISEEYEKNDCLSHLLNFVKQCGYTKDSMACLLDIKRVEVEDEE